MKFTEQEQELLRQLVEQYLQTLEALPEASLDENRDQLNLCLALQMKLDDGTDISKPAWSTWED